MFEFNEMFDFRRVGREATEVLEVILDVELRKSGSHFVVMHDYGSAYKVYSDYEDAKECYEVMSQERYGYHRAKDAGYRPQSEHEQNGFIKWHLDEDRKREIQRDWDDYLYVGHGALAHL